MKEKEICLTAHIEKGTVIGDRDLLVSMLTNFLDNARKAVSEYGQIQIRGRNQSGGYMLSISDNKYVILLIINLVLLVVGTFMDITPAVLIFAPIFLPVVESFGMHPIHFGIMMVFNLGIGNITPPVGSALFAGCSVANIDIEDMMKPVIPYYIALFIALMVVAYVPWLSMVIPEMVGAV